MMKSNRRIVKGKTFVKKTAAEVLTENKVAVARMAAQKISEAKQLNVEKTAEKDATSLTAEAIMKGQDATPLLLSVSVFFED